MATGDDGDEAGGADVESASELADATVVFTGQLSELTRAEVTELVEDCGACVTNNVSKQSDLLVVGDGPGDEKMTFLEQHEIPSLTEREFYSLFPERFSHVEGVPADATDEASGDSATTGDPTETVRVEVEPVVLQLARIEAKRTDRDLDSVVAESTQALLKRVIDGGTVETEEADDGETVAVALPENVHAMVETAVTTTAGVESVPAFVGEACRTEFGFDFSEKQELALGLPTEAVAALKQLSSENDRSVETVARELLCDAIEEALTASE
ncbi:BRCT domain-containing protein [Halorussus salinisoli]|uniref:BRCT domain-containing protein n=1 Tax=Halorussus salinisoli TaxID=2558242 RepID=UPI0014850B1A|nr:BRCT domain-containing protein [Halorussus salinisoli]